MWNQIKYPLEIFVTLIGGIGYVIFHKKLAANAWFISTLLVTLLFYVFWESKYRG